MSLYFTPLIVALSGALAASLLALIPALHIYNVAGLVILLALKYPDAASAETLAMFMLGMVVGHSMLNVIPAIFLSAPDEASIFVVLPAQKYLLRGRGYEAAILTGAGSLGGLAVLVLITPIAPLVLPALRALVQPHLHWILALVIVFMIQAEWPRGGTRPGPPLAKFMDAWAGLGAGILTFLLSGLLGFVLLYRSLVPAAVAFQNLLPAFVGFFAIPAVLQSLISNYQLPRQHLPSSLDASPGLLFRGVFAGALGGMFAAFFPIVTGGIGGMLAGHATAQRDERIFIISQGASKVLYYVGAYVLFFVPGLHLSRGGLASMVGTLYTATTPAIYYTVVAALAMSGALSFFLLLLFTRGAARVVERVNHRIVSAVTLVILIGVVFWLTGWGGLAIAGVASCIGAIPILWGTRRMHCLGVLLLPVTLNMAGLGGGVAKWLGLI